MDSLSDSDEENLEKLREATAIEFINDKMFNGKGDSKDSEIVKETHPNLPSLRPVKDDQEQFNLLDVTPEFRKFVAKRLGEHLERELQKRLAANIEYRPKKRRKRTGIKLLSDSEHFISLKEENLGPINVKKIEIKRRTIESENLNEEVKAKLCAVNPDDVLSKKGTEFWTERRKGVVFNYKRTKRGKLDLVEDKFK